MIGVCDIGCDFCFFSLFTSLPIYLSLLLSHHPSFTYWFNDSSQIASFPLSSSSFIPSFIVRDEVTSSVSFFPL